MYVPDTDTLSLLFAGHSRALARQATVPSAEIAITIITRIEVLQGRFDFLMKAASGEELLRAQEWLDETVRSLALVHTVIPIQSGAGKEFDRLHGKAPRSKYGQLFGHGHVKFEGILVIGKESDLTEPDRNRLRWRSDKVRRFQVHSLPCIRWVVSTPCMAHQPLSRDEKDQVISPRRASARHAG